MHRWLTLGLLLAPGLGGVAWAQSPARFDGQYMGELTLARTVGGDCTQPPQGSLFPLTIAGGEVRFAYSPRFGTTLVGRVDATGALKASARTKSGPIRMTGQIQANTLTANIVSPSCVYAFRARD